LLAIVSRRQHSADTEATRNKLPLPAAALNFILAALMFSFAGMFCGLAKIADRLAPPQ
jgi:hypothetical protein